MQTFSFRHDSGDATSADFQKAETTWKTSYFAYSATDIPDIPEGFTRDLVKRMEADLNASVLRGYPFPASEMRPLTWHTDLWKVGERRRASAEIQRLQTRMDLSKGSRAKSRLEFQIFINAQVMRDTKDLA